MDANGFFGWLAARRKIFVLLGLTIIAYASAINRAQTFLWVIPALLSATLITGFIWPHWLVKRLSVVRTGPEKAEEGETIHFQVEVRNQGVLPRFMIELVDHLPFGATASPFVTTPATLWC